MYFRDLQPYRYELPRPLNDVLAVGWLAAGHEYPKGSVEPVLIERLKRALSTHGANQMRGSHPCDLCAVPAETISTDIDGRTVHLGSAEIWIPGSGTIVAFAVPDLILHYITDHRYHPPAPFLEALADLDGRPDWNASLECERLRGRAFTT